jgi:hypothetical protein
LRDLRSGGGLEGSGEGEGAVAKGDAEAGYDAFGKHKYVLPERMSLL